MDETMLAQPAPADAPNEMFECIGLSYTGVGATEAEALQAWRDVVPDHMEATAEPVIHKVQRLA